jgi:hypothetical protein
MITPATAEIVSPAVSRVELAVSVFDINHNDSARYSPPKK